MTSLVTLAKAPLARIMIVGFPGSGKTGCLASLVNAGFKLRLVSFGANIEPLIRFVQPQFRANVEVEEFRDKMKGDDREVKVKDVPTAFKRFTQMLNSWNTTSPDGAPVSYGSVDSWGPDTILAVDDLTGMGGAARRRTLFVNNRTPRNSRIQDWGAAAEDQDNIIAELVANAGCHVVLLSHLKLIGPAVTDDEDEDWEKEVKRQQAENTKTRLYPTALGKQLPQYIHRHFGTMLRAEIITKGGKVQRVLRTSPSEALDIKVPAADIPDTLPIDTGLLTVFEAITKPGV